jgi:hypothetical protein
LVKCELDVVEVPYSKTVKDLTQLVIIPTPPVGQIFIVYCIVLKRENCK